MSRKNWLVLIPILLALVLFQHFVMEEMEEKINEDRFTRVGDLPASTAVPTYLASLFLGSFRAVVVDIFWIELKSLREERRFFEAKQYMDLICYLQPRNPEVWAMLAWDATYNIPEGGIADPEERWGWIRDGLLMLHRGNLANPRTPYLKFELGRVLWHKTSWKQGGWFDLDLMKRIEKDDELQRTLQEIPAGKPLEKRLSSFMLASHWLAQARDQIVLMTTKDRYYVTTQLGLNLHPSSMDGFIRECYFLEGMYLWRQKKFDEAKAMFRRTAEHVRHTTRLHGALAPSINDLLVVLIDKLPEIIDLHREQFRHPDESPERRKIVEKLVREMDGAMLKARSAIENGYLLYYLSPLKREMITWTQKEDDSFEFNDGPNYSRPIVEGSGYIANIAPFLTDVDAFGLWLPRGRHDRATNTHEAFKPRTITIVFSPKGKLPLRLRIYRGRTVYVDVVVPPRKRKKITFVAPHYGGYVLSIDASRTYPIPGTVGTGLEGVGPPPFISPPSEYYLQWLSTEPPLHDHDH